MTNNSNPIDALTSKGLVTQEQLDAMSPDQRKLVETLTAEEIRVLEQIKTRAQGNIGIMTDGNIIF